MNSLPPTLPDDDRTRANRRGAGRLALLYFLAFEVLVIAISRLMVPTQPTTPPQEFSRQLLNPPVVALIAGVIYWGVLWVWRRRAQVEQERQFFTQLAGNSQAAIFVADPAHEFRFTYVNAAAATQLGRAPDFLLGHSIWEVSPDLSRAQCESGWAEVLAGRPWSVRARFPRPDGPEQLAELALELLTVGSQRLLSGRARDVTAETGRQHRQTETLRQLLESQASLALATGTAGLRIWDYDVAASVVQWDARMSGPAELTGGVEAVPFATWLESVVPADRERLARSLAESLARSPGFEDEFSATLPNGQTVHLRVTARIVRDDQERALRAVGVTYDVTELREGERRLREQEAFIESVLNASRDGVMVFQAVRTTTGELTDLRWRLLNPAGERLLGRGRDQLIGQTLRAELPAQVTAGIWSRYAEVIETGHSAEFVHHFEGDRINAWLHVLAVKLGDGLMVEWRDVSREKEQQRRIEDSRNELELFNRLAQPFLTVTDPRRLFGELQATLASEFGATAAVVGFIEADGALALPAAGDQDGPRLWPKAEWQARWGEAPTAAAQIIPGAKDFPTALEPVAGQIAAPITLGGEVLGQIWLAPGTAGFTQSAGEQLERICQHLAGPFRAYLTEQRFNALRDRALALALENEAKFAAVFDHSLDALLLVEANSGQIVDCNAQAVSLFEAGSPERLIGTEGRLLAKNPRTPEAAVELRRQIAGGAGYEGDFEYRSLAGSVFWGHVAGRQMQLRGTDLQLFRITDISQRKAADQRLEAQATFRQQLIDSVPLPIFVKDTAGRYLECNRALSDFLGVSREQLLGKTVADVFTPDMAFEYQRRDEELLLQQQGLQIHRGQVRNAANEDRTVIFHRAAFQQGQGSLGGLIGTFIDVTDMDAASDRLRLQETALNAAASGLVITDRAGLILWANPAFSQLTGYTSEELAGKSTRLLRSGEQDAEFYHNLWQTITSGHVWRGELVNRRKDGSFYHEEMSITPVRGADGSIANFIAIKQDISARKQVELQYLRAQRMEGIGLLASGIAHDLNNVLAPVLLSIELLRSMHPDEDTTEILHTVELSARRGADIVRQVLTFARGVKGERIPLQSKHLVKDIVRVAKETFPKDIEVHIRTDLEVANVEGDPTQIHQVLLNLAVNGRDAMPDGGRLTLGAFNRQLTAPLEAVNGTIPPGEYVLLSVTDTGGGIPPQNLIRLFEPFFTTKETNQGTGLGLPTALGIVKSHNGYFRVVSELGKGTEFQVYLPMCFRDGQFTPSPRPAPPRGNGETVLVVDDEAGIRDIASEILSRYGYRVLTASDGTEAVALVAQHRGKIDLVLTDVMMPYMDGVALVRSLRKLAPNLHILAFSGLSNDATLAPKITELRRLGLPPVLSKPIAAPELLSAIHELISAPLPE